MECVVIHQLLAISIYSNSRLHSMLSEKRVFMIKVKVPE